MIEVVLVDDHDGIRELLRESIRFDGRMTVVGEATNGREAIEVVAHEHPDAVIDLTG